MIRLFAIRQDFNSYLFRLEPITPTDRILEQSKMPSNKFVGRRGGQIKITEATKIHSHCTPLQLSDNVENIQDFRVVQVVQGGQLDCCVTPPGGEGTNRTTFGVRDR